MTLRDRCKELVREWRAGPNRVIVSGERPDYFDVCDSVMDTAANIAADQLQAALDATEGEALDAARYRCIRAGHDSRYKPVSVVVWSDEPWEPECGDELDAAIDAAMKESKP